MQKKKSFAELVQQYQLLLSGLKKNEKELSLPLKISEFEKNLNDTVEKNKEQETLKAKTQQATKELKEMVKTLKGQSSQLQSTLYGKYGKKAEKLEEFGMKPWKDSKKTSKSKEK